jgi:hypothetical protein
MLNLNDSETSRVEGNKLFHSFLDLIDKLSKAHETPRFYQQPYQQSIQGSFEGINAQDSKSNENIIGKIWKWMRYEDQKELIFWIGAVIFMLLTALYKGCQ